MAQVAALSIISRCWNWWRNSSWPSDVAITLEDLAEEFGVSHERARQIEVRTFEKVQHFVRRRVAAMEGSQARIAHQPLPFTCDRRQQRTLGSTTHLRASPSDVSSVTAAA